RTAPQPLSQERQARITRRETTRLVAPKIVVGITTTKVEQELLFTLMWSYSNVFDAHRHGSRTVRREGVGRVPHHRPLRIGRHDLLRPGGGRGDQRADCSG